MIRPSPPARTSILREAPGTAQYGPYGEYTPMATITRRTMLTIGWCTTWPMVSATAPMASGTAMATRLFPVWSLQDDTASIPTTAKMYGMAVTSPTDDADEPDMSPLTTVGSH